MISIPRHTGYGNNPEFFAIRDKWHDSNEHGPFRVWLEKRNAKVELHEKSDHQVLKIIFDTEQEYLVFKLKYL